MSNFWRDRNVLVTGGSGFIGSHIAEMLVAKGARVTAVASASRSRTSLINLQSVKGEITLVHADLTNLEECLRVCQGQDVIINTAHADGSVAFKQARPAFIFRQNMLISLNMLEAASRSNVERFMVMSSAEVYSPDIEPPLQEHDGFAGRPNAATDGYAWSKRMAEFAADLFAREHGMKIAIARPNNVYGPRDYFDGQKGRVIPMFIRNVFQNDELVIWGTGEQVRTFLYVEDLARGILDLVEKYPECDAVNFAGEEEITIKELAELVVRLSGRDITIRYDLDKPAGPPNRTSDLTKARELLDFAPAVPLEVGLRRTIDMYREYYL